MPEERGSAQDCKATYQLLQKSLNGHQGYRWGVKLIRNLEETTSCDHIYDFAPMRATLRARVDKIDAATFTKITKHKESSEENSIAEEIVSNAKSSFDSHLSKAIWSARKAQCLELYDGSKEVADWLRDQWKNRKDP